MGIFIKYLKKLQDNLGDINDLYMQQQELQAYLENKAGKKSDSLKLASAIGALISTLNSQQSNVYGDFAKTFSDFVNRKNEKVFRELFMSD